jgi:hypothetical protein
MKIQKPGFLKNCGCIGIIAVLFLVISLVVAGCVQDNSGNSGQSAASSLTDTTGNSAPVQGAGSAAPGYNGQQGAGTSPVGGNYTPQHGAGNFLTNETRLAAAAETLGVSESDLKNALTPPAQGRVNFTTAAAQLGVTPSQLTSALGIPAGRFGNGTWQRGGYNTTNSGNSPGP